MRRMLNDSTLISVALVNIGLLHYKLTDFARSLRYYKEALNIKDRIQDSTYFRSLHINIALCLAHQKNFDQSLAFINKVRYQITNEANPEELVGLNFCLGFISFERGNKEKGALYFKESLRLSQEFNITRFQLDNIYYLSKHCIEKNDLQNSKAYLASAEQLLSQSPLLGREALALYESFVQLNKKLGDRRQVIYYQDKYISVKDSIYRNDFIMKMMSAEAEFRERENLNKLKAQAELIGSQEQIITKQQFINVLLFICAVLFILVSILLSLNIRAKKRMHKMLEDKVKERTCELEQKNLMLKKVHSENSAVLDKVREELKISVRTLSQLMDAATIDVTDEQTATYIHHVGRAVHPLRTLLNTLHLTKHANG